MQICVYDNAEQIGKAAAVLIASRILHKPDCVLGLATGSSPLTTYQELIRLYNEGILDFSKVSSFNLDEYVGIPETHVCSYHRFMKDNLFDHINIRPEATHVPSGSADRLAQTARDYDAAIVAAGNIDLQVLGIGRNGHIGFNEPGDDFIYECHAVDLTESTIEANTRFFSSRDEVPRKAISLGVGAIMQAGEVLLIATGTDKAQAIHDTVYGDVTPRVQASILRTHRNVTFLLDKAAASML